MLVSSVTKAVALHATSKKEPLMVEQILRACLNLLPPRLSQRPPRGHSANVQIVVKSATSKQIKSSYWPVSNLCHLERTSTQSPLPFPPALTHSLMIPLLMPIPPHRLCPMLNGTMKTEDTFRDTAFAMSAPAP